MICGWYWIKVDALMSGGCGREYLVCGDHQQERFVEKGLFE